MARLFIIRHASFDRETLRINDPGRKEMIDLAVEIEPKINLKRALVVTSPIPRAADSALILAKNLDSGGIIVEKSDSLALEDFKIEKAIRFLKSKSAESDIILAITHEICCLDFMFYFMRLKKIKVSGEEEIKLGQVYICVENF